MKKTKLLLFLVGSFFLFILPIQALTTNEIIKKYELSDIKEMTNIDENFFLQYANIIENNSNIESKYKKLFLSHFPFFLENKKVLKIDLIFDELSKFSLNVNDALCDEKDGGSKKIQGFYENNVLTVRTNAKENVISHEFFHFIYDTPHKESVEVPNNYLTELKETNGNRIGETSFGEALAEIHSTELMSLNGFSSTYDYAVNGLNILMQIVGKNETFIDFYQKDGIASFYQRLLNLGVNENEAGLLLSAYEPFFYITNEVSQNKEYYIYLFEFINSSIKIYEKIHQESWKENEPLKATIISIIYNTMAIPGFEKLNPIAKELKAVYLEVLEDHNLPTTTPGQFKTSLKSSNPNLIGNFSMYIDQANPIYGPIPPKVIHFYNQVIVESVKDYAIDSEKIKQELIKEYDFQTSDLTFSINETFSNYKNHFESLNFLTKEQRKKLILFYPTWVKDYNSLELNAQWGIYYFKAQNLDSLNNIETVFKIDLGEENLSCQIKDKTYYNKEGVSVSYDVFVETCGTVENPDTGSFIPIFSLITLSAFGIILYVFAAKKKIFHHI